MKKSNLMFKNYRADEIEFKFNNEKLVEKVNRKNKDNLRIEIGTDENSKLFAVKMTYEDTNINNLYDLKVVFIGQFELKEDDNDNINDYAPNAVAILFPYFRNTITAITTAIGMPPLILPIMNFMD